MKRSARPRRIGWKAWLLGAVFVGGVLVAFFSLSSTARRSGAWPLGIRATEVAFYSQWLDRRPADVASTVPSIFRIGSSKLTGTCFDVRPSPKWRTHWFETDGYGDSVEVRHLNDDAGLLLRFKKNAPLNGQRYVLLEPAKVESIRAKYLETLAGDLGLLTPGVSFVHVIGCGRAIGTYKKEERLDAGFIEQRGLTGSSLVMMGMDPARPDGQFAVIDGDSSEQVMLRGTLERALSEVERGITDPLLALVDERSAVAWLLMAWVDGRDLRQEPVWFAYQWSTGRLLPIYRAPRTFAPAHDDAPIAYNLLTPLLRRPEIRARFEKAQAQLLADRPELRERMTALDRSWLPVLAAQEALPFAQATAERTLNALLSERIGAPEAIAYLDRTLYYGPGHATLLHGIQLPPLVVTTAVDTTGLTALAKRYKLILQGDSILFPRGKFMIDRTITFPAGRTLVLLQGARLFMAAGASILCKGDLLVRGTLRNPVFIRPQEDHAPFGTIAVVGNGAQRCEISGLFISGGAGASLDGVPHTGMLSIHGMSRTVIHNSVLEENRADAALRIHGGAVELNGVQVQDGRKDLVVLEHASGVVRALQLTTKAKDGTANGLRIRSGQVAVIALRASGLRGAGLLVEGAAQVLVRNAQMTQNTVAINAIERAIVHVEGSVFMKNTTIYTGNSGSGARFVLYPNSYTENTTERATGTSDVVVTQNALDEATAVSFGVPLKEEVVQDEPKKRTRTRR